MLFIAARAPNGLSGGEYRYNSPPRVKRNRWLALDPCLCKSSSRSLIWDGNEWLLLSIMSSGSLVDALVHQ